MFTALSVLGAASREGDMSNHDGLFIFSWVFLGIAIVLFLVGFVGAIRESERRKKQQSWYIVVSAILAFVFAMISAAGFFIYATEMTKEVPLMPVGAGMSTVL